MLGTMLLNRGIPSVDVWGRWSSVTEGLANILSKSPCRKAIHEYAHLKHSCVEFLCKL